MAHLLKDYTPNTNYRYSKTGHNDRRQKAPEQIDPDSELRLKNSITLYVGNLTFFTTEEQIYELFSKTGEVKRLIMGLNRETKTPCGFCFVEYYTHEDAADCMKYLNGARLDDRPLRVDWDEGFRDGRQWGRGLSGGQVRDEFRQDFDPGRGGYGYGTKISQIQNEKNENENVIMMTKRKSEDDDSPGLSKKFHPSDSEENVKRSKSERFKDEIKEETDD